MELRHLRYFVAVAEEGHVTRAAERLGIQQPPLSQQIQALERELDAQLFHRKPRGVELTPAGRALFDEAKAILARTTEAIAATKRAARGEAGADGVGDHGVVRRARGEAQQGPRPLPARGRSRGSRGWAAAAR